MLDLKLIREQPEIIKKALKKKHVDPVTIDNIVALDTERRAFTKEVDDFLAKRNKASKEIAKLMDCERLPTGQAGTARARGKRDAGFAGPASSEAELKKKEMQYVKERLAELEPKLKKLDDEITELLILLPNPPLASVPEGVSGEENKVARTHGSPPKFPFEPLDHEALGKKLDMIDTESSASASGARFYYLKNDAVLLEFALVNFVLAKLMAKGFSPILPPVLVKEHAMFGTGFFPADRNEIYHVNPADDDLYLAGTSEVPLCMLYADKIIPAAELPKRFCAFSTCFRREAGSYGKDMHGIFRVHQFDKIEMFSFCHPDKSEAEHDFILSIEEEIMQELGLHYQVVNICGGDLGAPAAKKYDIEVWIPSQKRFRELTSCSNCTDFQARRCNIRYKDEKGNRIVHTLNGTAVAMSRMIIALMENFQTKEGGIEVPKCLKSYLLK